MVFNYFPLSLWGGSSDNLFQVFKNTVKEWRDDSGVRILTFLIEDESLVSLYLSGSSLLSVSPTLMHPTSPSDLCEHLKPRAKTYPQTHPHIHNHTVFQFKLKDSIYIYILFSPFIYNECYTTSCKIREWRNGAPQSICVGSDFR